jgi:hypothetical protein
MQIITNILIIVAVPCIAYTIYDIHRWFGIRKTDRSGELIEIFQKRASRHFNSDQIKKLKTILKSSITEYVKK